MGLLSWWSRRRTSEPLFHFSTPWVPQWIILLLWVIIKCQLHIMESSMHFSELVDRAQREHMPQRNLWNQTALMMHLTLTMNLVLPQGNVCAVQKRGCKKITSNPKHEVILANQCVLSVLYVMYLLFFPVKVYYNLATLCWSGHENDFDMFVKCILKNIWIKIWV